MRTTLKSALTLSLCVFALPVHAMQQTSAKLKASGAHLQNAAIKHQSAADKTKSTPKAANEAATSKNLSTNPVIRDLSAELKRSMTMLRDRGRAPLYFLEYRLYEGQWEHISASDGALDDEDLPDPWRMLSVELRVGSPRFDNTHYLRGGHSDAPHQYDRSTKEGSILPGAGAGAPLRQCLWLKTDESYKEAQQRFLELAADADVLSKEDDKSGDFCAEPMHFYSGPILPTPIDRALWTERVRNLSKQFLKHPKIEHSSVSLNSEPTTRYLVNSEGSEIIEQKRTCRFAINASTITEDGMALSLYDHISVTDPASMPDESVLSARVDKLAKSLDQLRTAPPAEPYAGPAILSGRAAAVFFHETFGHRVESVHEKSEGEGKTFAKRLNTQVMPHFISVIDDPTVPSAYGQELNGYYKYDDEGVPAQKVVLAKNGVLTNFLLNRVPVLGFNKSNGHARSSPGWNPQARQANLFVIADKSAQLSPQMLRARLLAEAKRQHKTYGLLFEEIAGGSTRTSSHSDQNQTYEIRPLRVYKIFVDGRPDELIRGAEIVGTPLLALERIIAAGNDYDVFNGVCGRDSGSVPVSASAPSLLLESIEIRRTAKSLHKPPILPAPIVVSQH